MLVLEDLVGLHRTVQLLQHYWLGIDLEYCDIEWFALEMNRDHSVTHTLKDRSLDSGFLTSRLPFD